MVDPKEIEARLKWKLKQVITDRDCEITSDPWTRTHTISVPRKDYRAIEYLHELAHAVLAERHHLLSTAYSEAGVGVEKLVPLVGPFRAASDWFADQLLIEWEPEKERAEIREHMEYVLRMTADIANGRVDVSYLYGGGLILAQGVKYCGSRVDDIPAIFRPVVDILLSVPPDHPTVEAKRDLVNRLAALTCRERIELTKEEDGIEVWKILKEDK